jgi:cell division protease FtsH
MKGEPPHSDDTPDADDGNVTQSVTAIPKTKPKAKGGIAPETS